MYLHYTCTSRQFSYLQLITVTPCGVNSVLEYWIIWPSTYWTDSKSMETDVHVHWYRRQTFCFRMQLIMLLSEYDILCLLVCVICFRILSWWSGHHVLTKTHSVSANIDLCTFAYNLFTVYMFWLVMNALVQIFLRIYEGGMVYGWRMWSSDIRKCLVSGVVSLVSRKPQI